MPDPRAERVAELVKTALEYEPEQWATFLDRECGNDPLVRADVESLLQENEDAGQFLEVPALHLAAESLVEKEAFDSGQTIGNYRIVSLIGTGGMGDIYLAEDLQLRRKVALKLVRAAMRTGDIVARFRHEEQILASLNNPNIAHLYGGGQTASGIPFFVMEYVEGLRIDEYCNRHDLSITTRLQLFRKVCSAVHYAHQHLVVHRDLKPSNILVTNEGEPKLLDFGIAKLLSTDDSMQAITLVGAMTPDYASPEQVRCEGITTASDVYSLGVILYELLAGRSPYRVPSHSPVAIARAITDQDPERPSTAITRKDDRNPKSGSLPAAAGNLKSLRGDLDTIILMAIRKEPARRYSSVAQFSDDIRRHLAGLPVVARKDTVAYRTSKFVSRNRLQVSAAALALFALIAAFVVSLWETENTRRQRDVAQRERSKAERINQFLHRMLSFSNQSLTSVSPVAQKKDVTVNVMLDQITPEVQTELATEPEVRAQVLRTIGSAYASQGQYDSAEKNLRAALEVQIQVFGKENQEVAATDAELGLLAFRQLRLNEASRLLEEAVAFYRKQQQQHSPDFNILKLAQSLESLGLTRFSQGDQKAAVLFLKEALQIVSSAPLQAPERAILAAIKTDLGGILVLGGLDPKEGDALLRESLADYRLASGPPRWELGATLTMLGLVAVNKDHLDEAGTLLREGEQIYRQALGDQNVYVSFNLDQQSVVLFRRNDLTGAEEKSRESLTILRHLALENKLPLTRPLWALGDILTKAGRPREGEDFLREALAIYEVQPKAPFSAPLRMSLCQSCLAQNHLPEAEESAIRAYDEAKRTLGQEAPFVKEAVANLIKVYQVEGKTEAVERLKSDDK